jgi:hypothetical protein
MARLTGLEPATPGVTGRYSNRLSYNRTNTHPGHRPSVRRVYASQGTASSAIAAESTVQGVLARVGVRAVTGTRARG